MHVVIDIPEESYIALMEIKDALQSGGGFEKFIVNGTPLPKGHGRMKDIDKIISDGISKGFCDWYDEMQYAPTIVEADKIESEE